MFCRNRSSSVPPFLDKSNRQQLLNLLLSGFAWNDPRRVCRILENKCVHSWRSRLECQPPDKKWSTAFNISCILFFFFSEVHPLWKPLAQLGSAPASSWLCGDPANNLPEEFGKNGIKENISIKRSIFLNQPLGELSLPSDRSQSFWRENIRHCLSNSSWFELFADGQKNVQLRNDCKTWTQRWHPRVPDPWAGLDCWSCSCRRAPSSDVTSMRLLLKFLSFVKRNSSDSCKKSTVICYFLHVSHVLSLDDEKKQSWWSLTIIFGSLWIVAWQERLEGKKAVSPVCARFGVIVLNYYIHAGARAISVSGNEKKESQLTVFGMCNYQGQMYYFVQL